MARAEADLYLGQDLNSRYEVRSFLATGGFCLVFEAYDRKEDRYVALKVLSQRASTDGRIEFETERELLADLISSSNVVTCYGADGDMITVTVQGTGAQADLPVRYLVLELAAACLTELLLKRSDVGWMDRLDLFRGVAKGLHQLHLTRTVHRDLKSENVLLFPQKHKEVVAKVTDLGRAKNTEAPTRFLPQEYLAGRGDLRFAPPELLWRLGYDHPLCWRRVDFYLLGSVFFEIVTGLGLTALALKNPFAILQRTAPMTEKERERSYRNELANMRTQFEASFQVLEAEVPSVIRADAGRLIRQLCDPDPERRKVGLGKKDISQPWDLQWVLRRIDIMVLQLRRFDRESGGASS